MTTTNGKGGHTKPRPPSSGRRGLDRERGGLGRLVGLESRVGAVVAKPRPSGLGPSQVLSPRHHHRLRQMVPLPAVAPGFQRGPPQPRPLSDDIQVPPLLPSPGPLLPSCPYPKGTATLPSASIVATPRTSVTLYPLCLFMSLPPCDVLPLMPITEYTMAILCPKVFILYPGLSPFS